MRAAVGLTTRSRSVRHSHGRRKDGPPDPDASDLRYDSIVGAVARDMRQRLGNLLQVTPRVRRSAELLCLVLLAGAAFGVETRVFLLMAVVLLILPGVLGAVGRLLGIPVLAAGTAGLIWLRYFGTYSLLRDSLLLGASVIVTLAAHSSWRAWFANGCVGRCPLFFGRAAVWAGFSPLWLSGSRAPRQTSSLAPASRDSPTVTAFSRWPGVRHGSSAPSPWRCREGGTAPPLFIPGSSSR
jgi:hypothetical protein